jgi:hypothetical protein
VDPVDPVGPVLDAGSEDGMVFVVPRDAFTRVGGSVEHHGAGAVSIEWDLGSLKATDPLQPYLLDHLDATLVGYLGEGKLSVHGAFANIDVLNQQNNLALFESTCMHPGESLLLASDRAL